MAFRRRLLLLLLATATALSVVWARMLHLQVVHGDAYRREALASTRRRESVLGPRGRIVDAGGEVLAHDRSVVQLVFSPGEWATRERFRCRRCAAVLFARTPRHFDRAGRPVVPPKTCSCGARREEFDPLPAEDLEPLEVSLNLPPGTLAAAADDRMEDIERTIAVLTANRVLGLEAGVRARARERVASIEIGAHVGAERATALAIDGVLAELAPELAERTFETEDVRIEQRTDRYSRPIVLTRFDGPGGIPIPLKQLSPEAERLLELDRDGRYRGFRAEPARERWYPRHGLLAQVIGITGAFSSREEIDAFRARFGADAVLDDTRVGRMGLEARYDEELRGRAGIVVREKDETGAFAQVRVELAPVRGKDLHLHLDAAACAEAHRALADAATDAGFGGEGAASAAFVGLEAETGHIRFWGEVPVYDLNGDRDQITKRLDEDEGERRDGIVPEVSADPSADPAYFTIAAPKPNVSLSRVARIAIEPGSSMKLVTALTLLHAGHSLPSNFVCAGPSRSRADRPGCHHHDPVDVVGMLGVSCNRFCAECSADRAYFTLHRELFPDWARRLGIGSSTGVDFPSASRGSYPATIDARMVRQLAIGQSMTATPLQMARLAALIANGRMLPFPRIAASVGDEPVRDGGIDVELEPTALWKVRQGMRACVETGTAHRAFQNVPALAGVTVYGKTGTATATAEEWTSDEAAAEGFEHGPWHLWFVGYAVKAGQPTIAFACVLHARKGKETGGDLAAPVVARFLSWWYAR